jgi:RecJ-like exonuclease
VKVAILAHGDADGVTAAAIVKSVLGGDVYFTHPVGLLEDFRSYARGADMAVILDISLDEASLSALRSEFRSFPGKILYIDHHPMPPHASIEAPNVEVVHEEGPCAAELAFRRLKPPRGMSRVALYGAIGDYAVDTEWVRAAMAEWDIKSLFLEAGVLVLGLDRIGRNYELKRKVVEELSRNALPSSVPVLLNLAAEQAKEIEEMRLRIPQLVKTRGLIAYVVEPGASVGLAAFYAAVEVEKPVGVAVEERKGVYAGSARARDARVDLNAALRAVAPRFGGSGGGHPRAAGFRVPVDKFEEFLSELERMLAEQLK